MTNQWYIELMIDPLFWGVILCVLVSILLGFVLYRTRSFRQPKNSREVLPSRNYQHVPAEPSTEKPRQYSVAALWSHLELTKIKNHDSD